MFGIKILSKRVGLSKVQHSVFSSVLGGGCSMKVRALFYSVSMWAATCSAWGSDRHRDRDSLRDALSAVHAV